MTTITYNPKTHVLVPKGMMYELLGLPMTISKGEFSKDLFDGFHMHQYAMRYLDEAIAAAPQPEPVDVDLRRDAELWRAHRKRKQLSVVKDCDDRYFVYDLSSEKIGPQVCLRSEDAARAQGEQK